MRVKVICNGELYGTKLINADTGEDLDLNISALRYEISPKTGLASLTITIDPGGAMEEDMVLLEGAAGRVTKLKDMPLPP